MRESAMLGAGGGAVGGAMNAGRTTAVPAGHVFTAMQDLDRRSSAMAELASQLRERLHGVLRPEPPSPAGKEAAGIQPACAPLAENINGISVTVNNASLILADILDRLEL